MLGQPSSVGAGETAPLARAVVEVGVSVFVLVGVVVRGESVVVAGDEVTAWLAVVWL